MAKDHGSETRKTLNPLTARFNAMETRALRSMINNTGHSFAELIRINILNKPSLRAVRRPTLNHKLAAQVLAQLAKVCAEYNKIGSNLNQLVRHVHAGHPQWNALQLALTEFTEFSENTRPEIRAAILQAFRMEPVPKDGPRPD
jgi:hypothetical protein